MRWLALLGLWLATAAGAEVSPPTGLDVYVLGEVHDNPAHHAEQARLVALIAPQTVVWEMLSPEQVEAMGGVNRTDAVALETALGWDASGWPDFAMYHPIFLAAGTAHHQGAQAPRDALTQVMQGGLAAVLKDEDIARWGLGALAPEDQATREADQLVAHCNALPPELLPGMVDAQRLRDWYLARTAVRAFEAGQGPVVVITGTGHARKDTGVPALIATGHPGLKVWSLGQTETGADADPAAFDALIVTPPTPREDPCLVFKSSG